MNIPEAKFILGAYRADGSDAADPTFAEALALAARDPELRAWLDGQRQFDRAVAAKVRALPPPPGLRESILAGGRASRPRPAWWLSPVTLAAAALVVLGAVAYNFRPVAVQIGAADLVAFALDDLATRHAAHAGSPEGLEGVQARLAGARLPLPGNPVLDLDELRRQHCRAVKIGGREVFEICFEREGTWYHLYAARRADFGTGELDPRSLLQTKGDYAGTAWADAKNLYALVVHDAPAALQRLL